MFNLTGVIGQQGDPVSRALRSFYGAVSLSQNEDERKRQLAEAKLKESMRLYDRQLRAQQKAKDEEKATYKDALGTWIGVVKGKNLDAQGLEATWGDTLRAFGLDPQQFPTPSHLASVLTQGKPELPKAPQTRTVDIGDEQVTQQWNGKTWDVVGRAPRYKPASPSSPHYSPVELHGPDGTPQLFGFDPRTNTYSPTKGAAGMSKAHAKKDYNAVAQKEWDRLLRQAQELALKVQRVQNPDTGKVDTYIGRLQVQDPFAQFPKEIQAAVKPFMGSEGGEAEKLRLRNEWKKRYIAALQGQDAQAGAQAGGQAPASDVQGTPPVPGAVLRTLKTGKQVWVVQQPDGTWRKVG